MLIVKKFLSNTRHIHTHTRPKISTTHNFNKMSVFQINNTLVKTTQNLLKSKLIVYDGMKLTGFKYYVRPSLIRYLPEDYIVGFLDSLKQIFQTSWKSLPISQYLMNASELPDDVQRIDWISTVWINNYYNPAKVGHIFSYLEYMEKEYFNIHKNEFHHTDIPTKSFPAFQQRFFSTDTTAPLNVERYIPETINYHNSDLDAKNTSINTHSALLSSLIPNINESYYPNEVLQNFTNSRISDIQTYLANLSKYRNYHPKLQNPQNFKNLERYLLIANNLQNSLFSIDLEAFEKDNNFITEIGVTIYDPLKEAGSIIPNFTKIHIIIKENQHLRNGHFVADNQQYFIGGTSLVLPLREATLFVQCLIDHYFIIRQTIGMRGVIVGHNVSGDIKWLKSLGINFPTSSLILDTQKIYTTVNNDKFSALGAVLRRLEIPHSYLHNAGNDSYFTLILLLRLCDVTFRNKIKLDDFNKDLKNIEHFEAFKVGRSKKIETQRNRDELIHNSRNQRRNRNSKLKSNGYEFGKDEVFIHHSDAIKQVFES